MKIKLKTKEAVIKQREQWHWYFAWYPITIIETEESSQRYFVWFDWVCRKFIHIKANPLLVSDVVYKIPSVQAKIRKSGPLAPVQSIDTIIKRIIKMAKEQLNSIGEEPEKLELTAEREQELIDTIEEMKKEIQTQSLMIAEVSRDAENKHKDQLSKLFTRVLLLEEEIFNLKKENFALKNGNPDAVNTENGGGS